MSANEDHVGYVRLVQFSRSDGALGIGQLDEGDKLTELAVEGGLRELALDAIANAQPLIDAVKARRSGVQHSLAELLQASRVLPPVSHPDPAHCLVSGTGLTHLASAEGRNAMHASDVETATDSLRMYRAGLAGGKPAAGSVGAQPEWFYKGDGSIIAAPGAPLCRPHFALDGGEEPELVGVYVIDPHGSPRRIGFSFGNEFSDHVLEKQNYLLLAHSKLRSCSLAPEIIIGDLPRSMTGRVRISRGTTERWSADFRTGEDNMCHSLANLEHHHFKYQQFRQAGDIHVHFFGTSTLSFMDGVEIAAGDVIEIELPPFSRSLTNTIEIAAEENMQEALPL